mmetsp:Transcript_6697/g.18360  ORF Transcript_6697/g.18360 Transcript_6697/m.18360 type:complete len:877 (-) Transcript_6697:100-2730(-)|eukprot:CAMPEP_0179042588 /NCGR_PEP_ID=MMETSP0796-20121207/16736_1 /TAXON_ID=73915 /ORGANISM="Pyrodinium bahamense, Strain pbaha01" /LENGTH=876 /DNA_ID=CAMNT_0020738961 /DNA_START=87 /DNA_END=2717 /DNA_ORIENTATION=-
MVQQCSPQCMPTNALKTGQTACEQQKKLARPPGRSQTGRRVQAQVLEGACPPPRPAGARSPAGVQQRRRPRSPQTRPKDMSMKHTLKPLAEKQNKTEEVDALLLNCVDTFVSDLISDAIIEDEDTVLHEYYVDSEDEGGTMLNDYRVDYGNEAFVKVQEDPDEQGFGSCDANPQEPSFEFLQAAQQSDDDDELQDFEDVYSLGGHEMEDGEDDEEDLEMEALEYIHMAFNYARNAVQAGLETEAHLSDDEPEREVQVEQELEEEPKVLLTEALPQCIVVERTVATELNMLRAPFERRPSVCTWFMPKPAKLPIPPKEEPREPETAADVHLVLAAALEPVLEKAVAIRSFQEPDQQLPQGAVLQQPHELVQRQVPLPTQVPGEPLSQSLRLLGELQEEPVQQQPQEPAQLREDPKLHPWEPLEQLEKDLTREWLEEDKLEQSAKQVNELEQQLEEPVDEISEMIAELLLEQAAKKKQAAAAAAVAAEEERKVATVRAQAAERLVEKAPTAASAAVAQSPKPQPQVQPQYQPSRAGNVASAAAQAPRSVRAAKEDMAQYFKTVENLSMEAKKNAESLKRAKRRTIIGAAVRGPLDDVANERANMTTPAASLGTQASAMSPKWALSTAPVSSVLNSSMRRSSHIIAGSPASSLRQSRQLLQKDPLATYRLDVADGEESPSPKASRRNPSLTDAYEALGAELHNLDERGSTYEDHEPSLSPTPSSRHLQWGAPAGGEAKFGMYAKQIGRLTHKVDARSTALSRVATSIVQRSAAPGQESGARRSRTQLRAAASAMAMDLGEEAEGAVAARPRRQQEAAQLPMREQLARVSSLGTLQVAPKFKQMPGLLPALSAKPSKAAEWSMNMAMPQKRWAGTTSAVF